MRVKDDGAGETVNPQPITDPGEFARQHLADPDGFPKGYVRTARVLELFSFGEPARIRELENLPPDARTLIAAYTVDDYDGIAHDQEVHEVLALAAAALASRLPSTPEGMRLHHEIADELKNKGEDTWWVWREEGEIYLFRFI